MLILLVKVTALFTATLIALFAARKSSAAMRHLLCVWTLAGSLLLPFAALLPTRAIAFRTPAIDSIVFRSAAIAHTAAWPWMSMALGLWAAGTVLLLVRLMVGYRRVARIVRSATPIEPPLFAAKVSVPVLSGILRPVVLLPRAAAEWPEWQRAAAVRHELMHRERNDPWANLVANFACALYWFHPLVWKIFSHLRREQEAACDDAVLHSGFDPAAYAEALLAVARNSTSTAIFMPGCPMTTPANLKSRIMRLLDGGIARRTSRATILRTGALFAGIILAIAVWNPVHAQESANTVYKVGDGVTSPAVVYKVDPQYTEEARRDKIAGTVTLSVIVGTDGKARHMTIVKSLDTGLDLSAIEAVEQWRFAPGTLNGQPVAVSATIEINFRLR